MNVLFIVMEFPPLNVAGVYRPIRIINGLIKYGIKPIVITFEIDENFKKNHHLLDFDLLKLVDPEVEIIRIPIPEIAELFKTKLSKFINIYFNSTDNYYKAWKKNLFKEIPKIVDKYKPRAIITTCPPFSAAILGKDLSKKYALPLVLDMRDAWAEWAIVPLGSYFHYLHRKNVERKVFKQASSIISVTPQLLNKFKMAHPSIDENKFHLIFNTATTDKYSTKNIVLKPIQQKEIIKIGYSGSFYYNEQARNSIFTPWWKKKGHHMFQYVAVKEDWLYRSPYFFLQALSKLFQKRPDWVGKIEFHYNGEISDWLLKMIDEAGLRESVKLNGFLNKKQVEENENDYDLLLTTSEKVIGSEHFCLPSKLFSYLLTAKPILGFVTSGIQKEFLQNCGIGICLDPDNTQESINKLEQLIQNGFSGKINEEYLLKYSNNSANELFFKILNSI